MLAVPPLAPAEPDPPEVKLPLLKLNGSKRDALEPDATELVGMPDITDEPVASVRFR